MSILAIRWRDGGMEARCPLCDEYLPTTEEYWNPRGGVTRCRACWAEYFRLKQLHYTSDEAVKAVVRLKNRMRYKVSRVQYSATLRRWRAANVDRIAAYNAAYKARATHPELMVQYHLDWPDKRMARRVPVDSVEERRRQWRESKRRTRAAA